MQEVWKNVPTIPELEASSFGRVKRKPHCAAMPHGGRRWYVSDGTFGVIRRANKKARHEYRGYYYRGIGNIKIHRVVCEAFHGQQPEDKPVVIHINENSLDNRPENLRWGTQKENLNSNEFIQWKSQPFEVRKSLMEEKQAARVIASNELIERLSEASA